MNDGSVVQAPASAPRGGWLDTYMPEGQLAVAQPQMTRLNFAAIRGVLFRQRWLMLAVVVAALVAGLVVTLLTPPTYEAKATVRVSPYGANILQGQNVQQDTMPNQVYAYLSTQIEVIKSRSLAETIAADLKLGARYDLLGKDVDNGRPGGISDKQWLKAKEAKAASILAGSVAPELPRENYILKIGFRSGSAALAAEMANAYADAFVKADNREKISSNAYALEYLRGQIQEVRARLAEAEQASNLYARRTGIVVQQVTDQGGAGSISTLTANNLASINQRVATARVARIEAEQRWRTVQSLPPSQLQEVQSSPLLQTIVNERNAKMVQLTDLRQKYSDDFSQIVALQAQIKALEAQIDRNSNEIKGTLRNAFIVAQNQERALEAELAAITGQRLIEQEKQIEYGVLEREAGALRDQLKVLLDRYNEINSAAQVDSGAITKLDPAVVPGAPVSPNLTRNLGLALVFGLAIAAGLAVLRETLDDKIRTLEDVETKVGLPMLGHTPQVAASEVVVDGSNPFGALMEAYSSIRAAIDFSQPRNRNVIQLTSAQAGEGKSTTAVILAELFANLGRSVLLIDGDLRRPSIAKLLEIERPKTGIVEVLLGHGELADALIKGAHENLSILPVGEIPPNPSDLLASNEFAAFIERARREYSLVIIDCSPVLGMADAPLISRLVDATIFVMEANKLPFGQARTAVKRLRQSGANVVGVILTKYNALEAGQSYNYQYGYYEYRREAN